MNSNKKRIRVLWLSNKVLGNTDTGSTGTWLDALAEGLVASNRVELGNISESNVTGISRQDCDGIAQWVVPSSARARDGSLNDDAMQQISRAVEQFAPDVVHVWGTETYWGLLTARGLTMRPVLLETQGIKAAIAAVYAGGLSLSEQLASIGLKEIVRGKTVFQGKKEFENWSRVEREIISHHRFVTVQSEWLAGQILAVNPTCKLFRNDFALRRAFYTAPRWESTGSQAIFCTAAYPSPFKGVHVALRALAVLKRRGIDVVLRIAGAYQKPGLRQDGYVRWLNREAASLDVADNVRWLGSLSAQEIVSELRGCAMIVLPSFIEGYSLAIAEAMLVGTPVVAAFVGGVPSLGRDEESALYFAPGDETMCAHQMARVLFNRELAQRLSDNARGIALVRNDRERIVNRQLEIYRVVLDESNSEMPRKEQERLA